MKKEWERTKKENENLRELIKLKDRQIEEQLNVDEKDRDTIEKIQKENKDLRNQLIKRDFEMKEVVKTIKLFQDEKNRLEKELDKLHRENDQLIGHKNPSQKIQHHLKIKEENNKLREENFKLQEDLRRKTECIANRSNTANGGASKTPNSMEED
jgi:kinesin family protein 15